MEKHTVKPSVVRNATMLWASGDLVMPVINCRANATTYGLGASVWSSDTKRAHEVASQIEAGTVWINKHLDVAPHIPFGGAKQSGIGTEFAEEGLAEFTQLQITNGPGAST